MASIVSIKSDQIFSTFSSIFSTGASAKYLGLESEKKYFENGVSSPEKLDDFEMGWRYINDQFRISSNLYYMNYTNQLVLTGAIDDVGAPIQNRPST